MDTKRVKSIGVIAAVLITGILLGLFIPGTLHHTKKQRSKTEARKRKNRDKTSNDWFARRISRVIDADSAQMKEINRISFWANEQLDSIEQRANEQSILVMESAATRLTPFLRDDQQKSLQEFRDQITSWMQQHSGRN